MVKKIADEHGARVRIVNRHGDIAAATAVPGGERSNDGGVGPITGALVSISFTRLAPPSA